MSLRNRNYTNPDGKTFYFMTSKPTDDEKIEIYLVNSSSKGTDYSLCYIKFIDNEQFSMSPYDGEDTKELIMELTEKFLENAWEIL